ncbi:GrpB domain, predicted nucleotidyltransferase, UPF0157 family [Gracilibacillus ureilyticus]|uniref:GrpB domain, predicted nucleotidyltransferase, UPF0157 family n=1 Tax=Gracilibacillus ureilyticus TaxID=531814 RepID=A0A1H9V922_9BACI|nr:GrpB family protein [Gracilibacillus ureilyticus]SES18276.1 GrpB domain, predicted nucleotidyltransferase, UPF0157 family [Gracilibacillus ureilyticus]
MPKPTVTLTEYNPDWVNQYKYEAKRIIKAIGDKAAGIEHIGSTSVKGLAAKPIIDILVGVEELKIVNDLIAPLEKIENEYVPKPEWTDRYFFRKGVWGRGTCHLHVCEINSREWVEKLLFRNYLRKNPQTAEKYASLKRELAVEYNDDRPEYTRRKEPFIYDILVKAVFEQKKERG